MSRKALDITIDQVRAAVEATDSAYAASVHLNVTYSSFIRYAQKFGLYKTNMGGKGRSKPNPALRTPSEELFQKGKKRSTTQVKNRLFAEGLKENRCEECDQEPMWNGKPLVMHLDHVDGDNTNNQIFNLRILCPNCHTQTSTYCRGQYRGGKKTLVN